ncbi:hypothetical protein J2125_004549 [Erwinia toletana]|uniref:DUF4440 domain-containing protein n=1 Tax=Winslowiella toletana TaxID=92490 RepID=A0ABS4PFD2_9GAMM|nr:nuclear transport factor 2 family protein [Winslowiella toletana]MBP2171357.1 hypothetical protein [Winslowiella toletana]
MLTDLAELLPVIQQLEIHMHQQKTRRDVHLVNKLLHKEFVEIGRSGQSYTREQTIAALATESSQAETEASDFALAMITDGVALLTYKSCQHNSTEEISQRTLRSSIWVMSEDGNWQMRFHQGTPAAD